MLDLVVPHLLPPFFLSNAPATTAIYPLSLHDALPISVVAKALASAGHRLALPEPARAATTAPAQLASLCRLLNPSGRDRSEEHTSELQSRQYLVCRLLLEKKKTRHRATTTPTHIPHAP